MVSRTFTLVKNASLIILFYWMVFLVNAPAQAQTLPAGFSRVQVASGISKATTMAFAPDGRIFVAQQNGILRIIKNGKLLATPFMQINVASSGERGLIGLAFDPNFTTNRYIYVYYTLPNASRNRISRFTANGDVVVPGSEVVVLDLSPLSSANNHNGGAMNFGKDGKLYVAIGDNATPANAQNLDIYHGKLLRINSNGTIPSGNPFTSGSAQRKRIWAYGLRNPYTFAVQPGTGKIFVNDVGQISWEEINDATTGGKNFGWPVTEGMSSNKAYVNPVYAYPHGSTDGTGCAITGGVFFNPATTNYPAAYRGRYFYQDLCNSWINVLDVSTSSPTRQPFAKNLGYYALGLTVGTDGNLYYLERSTSAVYKIIYTTNSAPKIVQQPASISVSAGQPATFNVAVTGQTPFTYQWQKNGVNISGATGSSYTLTSTKQTDAGNYRVIVKNTVGSATSNNAALTVTGFNDPPVAVINTPATNSLYRGGQIIQFSGSATDTEDGTLPASAFTWSVDFHHDTHHHDGPPVAAGVKSGSFTIPNSGEVATNVWYRLSLVVKDSKGLTHTVYRDIHPHLSILTLATQPAGLKVTVDGQPINTPVSINSVEGIKRSIGPVDNQILNNKTYVFDRWLHGGTASQTFATPQNNTTYTAVYRETSAPLRLEAENALLYGAKVSSAHGGYTGTGFVDYMNLSGDYIEWSVNVPTAGSYNLSFRYALLSGSRSLRLQVNNTVVSSALAFTATGQWTTWSNKSLNAALVAGTNKIRLTTTGTLGPDMDHLVVTKNATTTAIIGPETEISDFRVYPNPAKSYVNVTIPLANKNDLALSMYNNQGKLVYTFSGNKENQVLRALQIPVGHLPKGLYVLKIQQGKTQLSEVILLEN